jgi:hypothetical protein
MRFAEPVAFSISQTLSIDYVQAPALNSANRAYQLSSLAEEHRIREDLDNLSRTFFIFISLQLFLPFVS